MGIRDGFTDWDRVAEQRRALAFGTREDVDRAFGVTSVDMGAGGPSALLAGDEHYAATRVHDQIRGEMLRDKR